MNAGQYDGIMARLGEILDRMPERTRPAAPERPGQPVHAGVCWFECDRPEHKGQPLTEEGKQAASLALYTLLTVLNDWTKGAHDNHEALGHRGEGTGSECWRSFDPSDIRNMINDAARELGLSEFPMPAEGHAKEDQYR